MPLVGIGHCPSCQAVVNVNWPTCPACRGAIKDRHPAPFKVGDYIVYQVPGDPEEGPFEVLEVLQDLRYGYWQAHVFKPPDTLVLIQQTIVKRVIPQESLAP